MPTRSSRLEAEARKSKGEYVTIIVFQWMFRTVFLSTQSRGGSCVIAITPRPSGRRWGTISFASTLHLSPVLDLLLADAPQQWRAELRLGLQEALVNAAKHGNHLDPEKTVLVEFFLLDDEHWWIISDQGCGFTPPCTSDFDCTNQPFQDQKDCGRGLYILHQIFDQVCWNAQGTELRLCKKVKHRVRFPLVS